MASRYLPRCAMLAGPVFVHIYVLRPHFVLLFILALTIAQQEQGENKSGQTSAILYLLFGPTLLLRHMVCRGRASQYNSPPPSQAMRGGF